MIEGAIPTVFSFKKSSSRRELSERRAKCAERKQVGCIPNTPDIRAYYTKYESTSILPLQLHLCLKFILPCVNAIIQRHPGHICFINIASTRTLMPQTRRGRRKQTAFIAHFKCTVRSISTSRIAIWD